MSYQYIDSPSSTMDASSRSFAISIASLAAIALASVPHASHAAQMRSSAKRKYQALTEKYEDEDGIATEDSQESFSDLTTRIALVIGSFVGTALAIASAVLTLVRPETADHRHAIIQQWLQFASWVCGNSSRYAHISLSYYRSFSLSRHATYT